ncbi:MAG: hypothetical protein COT90_05730 [Candidatus Diapherotrites archaeon CG10_big_fil_rev_8_21_14_0_10_31_34]|nr:MAG: hypothetical protein COT90_05730 [Candidatus Diapherotrites archaeon CG10_big_fil_rev_8_21_14_0_10_31_34]PJA19844.1 MAG: hypothetical protein COX63_01240 [Candidatus Diapherotrites archaeon CG_4_10_14_0_2_um_filter_31_5]
MNTLKEKFKQLILKNQNKNIGVLHHTDSDGICAGVITAKALERINGKLPMLFHQNPGQITLQEKTVEKLKRKKIDFLISVDLSLDQNPEPVFELEEFSEILILDHHKKYNNLNSKKTLMIKSEDLTGEEGSKYPASKLCFDLFSDLTELNDLDWVAAIGLTGDNAYSEWKDFVDSVLDKYDPNRKRLEKNILVKVTELIDSIEVIDSHKITDLVNVFLTAKKPQNLMKQDLLNDLEELENELNKWIELFKENKEVFPEKELVYFEIKPEHSIKSVLINRLSETIPNKTLVIVQDFEGEHVYFSARRQDFKVKVNDLLEKCVKGFPDSGAGGHIPAAAGKIPREYLKEFKKKLIENCEKGK